MYTKMKSGGFGLCYHREEITFQLKTTTLFGVGGHTGQAGNSSFKNTSGQHTPALLPEEMVPPHHLLPRHFPPYFGTVCEWNRSRNYLKLNFTGRRVFLTWNSSLMPFIMQQYKPFLPVQGGGETLMLDMQVYASLRLVGSNSLKNGRQSFSSHTTDSN